LPAEALTAATLNAAHAVGLGHLVGSLEVGKLAAPVVPNMAFGGGYNPPSEREQPPQRLRSSG